MKRLDLWLAAFLLVGAGPLTADDKKEDPLKDILCVVSGKPVKAEAVADYKEGKIYFCCPGCPGAFEKDQKKFAAKANHQLVATKQYEQVHCPFTGKPGKADVKVSVNGVGVSLCCQSCQKKANSAKDDKDKDKLVDLLFNEESFEKGFAVTKK